MKKFYFLLAVLPLLYSCYQEYEELDSFAEFNLQMQQNSD